MRAMPLSRATALIALVLIVILSAGYAAADRTGQEKSSGSELDAAPRQ